jgi:septal ring factor EnvC (AmiA/AmiB activator)
MTARCAKHNQARRYGTCHPNWINAELIFQALHEALQGFHDDPAAIEEMLSQTAPDRPRLEADLERARAAAKAVQTKRERLALTLADGKMIADVYRGADDCLIEELEHVTSQATKIQTRLARLPSLEDLAADPD